MRQGGVRPERNLFSRRVSPASPGGSSCAAGTRGLCRVPPKHSGRVSRRRGIESVAMKREGRRKLLCAAAMAAAVLAGCRKSENRAAPAATNAPASAVRVHRGAEGERDRGIRFPGLRLGARRLRRQERHRLARHGPGAAAELGQNSPAVKQAYPTFPDSERAGFVFEIPSLAAGPHLLVVTIEAKDGGRTDLKRHLQIQ